ncbi:MAG TPA: sigma-70 family RNA polymerase sigma factor [Steroidobacteraceae bacterium]|nr:sigma-70 family RNA polymerase sigma factor [Steroidobacteraceae bacterium]
MAERNPDLTLTIQRERSRLLNFIRRRVPDRMDAEDILQDVLYSFIEAFRLPNPVEHASAWLYQVARNRIIDRFRKRREERLGDADGNYDGADTRLDLTLPSADGGPDAQYARQALMQALQQALAELPEAQRAVFIAHEIEGRSFRDLSIEANTSVNTLLARKRYAVIHLRSRLRAAYDELGN